MNAFIFDVDGTLIDSKDMYMKPLLKVLNANGYNFVMSDLDQTFGINALDAVTQLGVKEPQRIVNEWFGIVDDYKELTHVFPNIKEMLQELSSDNGNHLAIATSKLRTELLRDVEPYGLNDYFSAIISSDDVDNGKPAPDMVLKGIEKLNSTKDNTVYIGDTLYDLEAAHRAGVSFALAGWETDMADQFKSAEYYLTTPQDLLTI
ncbi:HAD family hydrolase [Lentilactobacillus sp. SPB1-3]|uniref:HAD family hydrolase n=1 Tax=Lentilactobacillus terminaliae TaxID=3003483 RepID=A0ACD5DG83_9LACO|nr:HAD family hydrolase [Lentilactobacillus sp. SPB1-3]MCZ0976872.1 HAD family hydrolase [Lentilactobacillus sp. SPB1-3]